MSLDQGGQFSTEAAEPDNVGSDSAGERLKKARLALDLSVSDVSTRLKLSADKIESFERGDIAGIATPVFVAGYLRSYARLLGLPEDEVLADFEILPSMQSSTGDAISDNTVFESASFESMGSPSNGEIFTKLSSSENFFRNSTSLLMPIVLSVLVIATVYFLLLNDESIDDAKVVPATTASSALETTSRLSGGGRVVVAEKASAMELPAVQVPSVVNEMPVIVETSASATNAETGFINEAEQEAAKIEVFQQSELALEFNDDSWVEVTDARGERLVYRLAKAGMSRTVTGVAPFTVQLGYVPGVEIFYNGVPYDLSRFAGRRSAQFNIGNASDSVAGG